jgi:hypothetical protein
MNYLQKKAFQVLLFLSFDDEIATAFECNAYTPSDAKKLAEYAHPCGIVSRIIPQAVAS